MFELEKVGVPENIKEIGFKKIYPFESMEIGDSFVYDHKKHPYCKSAGYHHSRRKGGKFAFRKQNDLETRCFRVK